MHRQTEGAQLFQVPELHPPEPNSSTCGGNARHRQDRTYRPSPPRSIHVGDAEACEYRGYCQRPRKADGNASDFAEFAVQDCLTVEQPAFPTTSDRITGHRRPGQHG